MGQKGPWFLQLLQAAARKASGLRSHSLGTDVEPCTCLHVGTLIKAISLSTDAIGVEHQVTWKQALGLHLYYMFPSKGGSSKDC